MNIIPNWLTGQKRIKQLETQLASAREFASEYAREAQKLHLERDALRDLLQDAHRCINIQPKAAQGKVKTAIDVLGGWEWKK